MYFLSRSFPRNVLFITVHVVPKLLTSGFQVKIAFTISFAKIELEGWGFPAAAYVASLCQLHQIGLTKQFSRGWQYPQLGLPSP